MCVYVLCISGGGGIWVAISCYNIGYNCVRGDLCDVMCFCRPMWVEFPRDKNVYVTEDQFMIGMEVIIDRCVLVTL